MAKAKPTATAPHAFMPLYQDILNRLNAHNAVRTSNDTENDQQATGKKQSLISVLFAQNKHSKFMRSIHKHITNVTEIADTEHAMRADAAGNPGLSDVTIGYSEQEEVLTQIHTLETAKSSHACATITDIGRGKQLHLWQNNTDVVKFEETDLTDELKQGAQAAYVHYQSPQLGVFGVIIVV